MTNFILFHKQGIFPKHLKHCIKQIQYTQKNYKIYLLTDYTVENCEGVEVVNLKQIDIDELNSNDFYKNDNEPLWRTSFERFFYINKFIKEKNLDNIIHFDNDVLIYHDVKHIILKLQNFVKDVGLPKHKQNEFVCGFMYIKHKNSLQKICDLFLDITKTSTVELEKKLNGMPHEMRLLGYINSIDNDIITTLPCTPIHDENKITEECGYIFDPSTYGQYFDSYIKNTVHPKNVERIADKYIVDGTVQPVFDKTEKKPYVYFNGNKIPILNLHIHSKNLADFCSY